MITQDNITAEMKGDKLILTIDVSKKVVDKAPRSGSGKNRVVASTRGFLKLNSGPTHLPEVQIGLNVITK